LRGHCRQNALADLTNLGHVTPFLLFGPPHGGVENEEPENAEHENEGKNCRA